MKHNVLHELIKNSENVLHQFTFSRCNFSKFDSLNAFLIDKALSTDRANLLITIPDKDRLNDFFLPATLIATRHCINANTSACLQKGEIILNKTDGKISTVKAIKENQIFILPLGTKKRIELDNCLNYVQLSPKYANKLEQVRYNQTRVRDFEKKMLGEFKRYNSILSRFHSNEIYLSLKNKAKPVIVAYKNEALKQIPDWIPFQYMNKSGKVEPDTPFDSLFIVVNDFKTIKEHFIEKGIPIDTIIFIGDTKYCQSIAAISKGSRQEKFNHCIFIGTQDVETGENFEALKWNWTLPEMKFFAQNQHAVNKCAIDSLKAADALVINGKQRQFLEKHKLTHNANFIAKSTMKNKHRYKNRINLKTFDQSQYVVNTDAIDSLKAIDVIEVNSRRASTIELVISGKQWRFLEKYALTHNECVIICESLRPRENLSPETIRHPELRAETLNLTNFIAETERRYKNRINLKKLLKFIRKVYPITAVHNEIRIRERANEIFEAFLTEAEEIFQGEYCNINTDCQEDFEKFKTICQNIINLIKNSKIKFFDQSQYVVNTDAIASLKAIDAIEVSSGEASAIELVISGKQWRALEKYELTHNECAVICESLEKHKNLSAETIKHPELRAETLNFINFIAETERRYDNLINLQKLLKLIRKVYPVTAIHNEIRTRERANEIFETFLTEAEEIFQDEYYNIDADCQEDFENFKTICQNIINLIKNPNLKDAWFKTTSPIDFLVVPKSIKAFCEGEIANLENISERFNQPEPTLNSAYYGLKETKVISVSDFFRKKTDGKNHLFLSLYGNGIYTDVLLQKILASNHKTKILCYEEEAKAMQAYLQSFQKKDELELRSSHRERLCGLRYPETPSITSIDDENIDIDEWIKYLIGFDEQKRTRGEEQQYDIVFEDGTRTKERESRSVLVDDCEEVYKEVCWLKKGDRVRIYQNPDKEALHDLIKMTDKTQLFSRVDYFSSLWRNSLKDYYNTNKANKGSGYHIENLFEELKENGLSVEKHSLENWMKPNEKTKFPKKRNLRAIIKTVNHPELNNNSKNIFVIRKEYSGRMIKEGVEFSEEINTYILSKEKGRMLTRLSEHHIQEIILAGAPMRIIKEIKKIDEELID